MTIPEIILLSIIQGLTEFLPVSSSGHLVVANALLQSWGSAPVEDLVEVNIVLHLGTLAAVLAYYRREIVALLGADRRVIGLLIVGTIPAAIAGVYLKKGLATSQSDLILKNPMLAGFMFPVTAAMLIWAMRRRPGEGDYRELTWGGALAIGSAQAAAILGAGALEGLEVWEQGQTGTPAATLAIGFLTAMLIGLFALAVLIRWVERGKLALFAYYLVPLGIAVVVWQAAT